MRYELFHPKPEDLDKIIPKECYSLGELGCSKDLIKLSWLKTKDSLCMGFGYNGKVHGIAGSYRSWPGVAQGWAVFDGAVDSHPLSLTKMCHSLLDYARKEQELRRLSLVVRSGYSKGERFARSIGFSLEGELLRFLPDGGDALLFARLF